MQIHIHIHQHGTKTTDVDVLHNIFTLTKSIHNKTSSIMATIEEKFNDVFTKLDASTNRLADQIRDLKGQIANQGLPADKEEAILARMEGIANNLDQIGKDPENPVPVEPEPPVEGEQPVQ